MKQIRYREHQTTMSGDTLETHISAMQDQSSDIFTEDPSEAQTPNAHDSSSPTDSSGSAFMTPVIWCILVTETAERVCYFGFRAVLVLYFVHSLGYEESTAIALFAYVTCLAYGSPLLGALLADGSLGRYSTILYFGVFYAVGMVILTIGAFETAYTIDARRVLTFVGLILICLGTGGIKPCVSAFGADQVAQDPGQTKGHRGTNIIGEELESPEVDNSLNTDVANKDGRVRVFFAYFYFCINLGAVGSIFAVPIIKAHYGFGAAFLVPTMFLICSLGLFRSKKNEYVHHVPGQGSSSLVNTFRLCGVLLRQRFRARFPRISRYFPGNEHALLNTDDYPSVGDGGTTLANDGENEVSQQQLEDAAQALHVFPIMLMLPMFWMLYDQQGSVWTLQATRMSLHGLQPEQLNIVNPVEIMLFIPLFNRYIYPAFQARRWNIAPLRRMGMGMILAALSFFVSGILETSIQSREEQGGEKLNVFWQLPQITILTVAEILLSVTGLEFAYSTSPERMKAFLMAVYLLTTAIGDFFGGLLYSSVFQRLNRAIVMHVCAILMLGNFVLFCFVAKWWERCEAEKNAAASSTKMKSSLANSKPHILLESSAQQGYPFSELEMKSKDHSLT